MLSIAVMEETGQELVIYQALYEPYKIWARPLSSFTEELDPKKYPEAGQKHRFEPAESAESAEPEEEETPSLLEEFLDTADSAARAELLLKMREDLTPGMIDTMAIACGLEIREGTPDERFDDLLSCLKTRGRYEQRRY